MPYTSIPTKAVFESDSRFLTAHRNREPLTVQVDNALGAYHGAAGAGFTKQFALAMLFWACDRWLKHVAGGTNQHFSADARRRPKMMELYKVVVDSLASSVGIHQNSLPNWLQTTFGRDLSAHGINLDVVEGLSQTLTAQELEKYRLHFSEGKAYQKDWWGKGATLVPADSKTCTMVINGKLDDAHVGFSGYALTLSQDFYMAPHFVKVKGVGFNGNFYHSSYRGGGTVACAGTIRIAGGQVQEITNKSGHYQPTTGQLIFAIETLRLLGVDMTTLNVDGFGLERQTAAELLAGITLEEMARQNAEASAARDLERRTKFGEMQAASDVKKRKLQLLLAHWGPLGPHKSVPRAFAREKCDECKVHRVEWDDADRVIQARA